MSLINYVPKWSGKSVTDLITFQTVGYSRKQYQLNIPHTDHRQTQFHGGNNCHRVTKINLKTSYKCLIL